MLKIDQLGNYKTVTAAEAELNAAAAAWAEERFWERAVVESHWCLIPRPNHNTRGFIWLRKSIKMTQTITGPGEPAIITRYYTPEDYTLEMLRR